MRDETSVTGEKESKILKLCIDVFSDFTDNQAPVAEVVMALLHIYIISFALFILYFQC